MRIGIDGNEANVERKVGISEFAYRLLLEFYKNQDIQFEIYLKGVPRQDMPREREGWKYKIVKPRKFWTQFGLPLNLYTQKNKPDVFFSPTHYAPRMSPVPTVISIMDLAYIYFPYAFKKNDLYQLKNWTAYSVRNSKKIVTISQSSKNDIIKVYKTNQEKVAVVYPGIKQEDSIKYKEVSMEELQKKYHISKQYILFVGTLQPRKNVARLIEAFTKIEISPSKNQDLELVVIGKKGWLYEEIMSAPQKFGVEDKVKFLDFVGDDDLPSIYKHAQLYVLPSLYEGFGLPVLEAMKYGCPVATSNISSLPEAGGDAALYFDPESVDDIAKTITKILEDEKLRKSMIQKGYEQIKKFSWEKSAKEVLDVLQQVAEKK